MKQRGGVYNQLAPRRKNSPKLNKALLIINSVLFVCSLVVGVLCLLLAFISGGIVGALLLLCRRGKLKQAIPFGPFLCAAAVTAYFWGREIITWYWRMFL